MTPSAPSTASSGFNAQESRQARRLGIVIALVAAFFVLELAGALAAESVVLQADALHLLMDILALGVSLFAMRLAVRRPTPRFTYGLRRAEPVAAIFSATLVLGTTAFIVIEAVGALQGGAPPRPGIMLAVATAALFVNGLSAWLLHDAIGHGHEHGHAHTHDGHPERAHAHAHAEHGHAHDGPLERGDAHAHHSHPERAHGRALDPDNPDDVREGNGHSPSKAGGHALNLRGAWLHLVGDTLGALAALVAALVIRFGGSPSADPIASFVVAAILVVGALRLGRDATLVLLEAAPPHMPIATIRGLVAATPGVVAIHDLHVWTLGAGHDAITVHVRTDSRDPEFGQRLSDQIRRTLGAEYVTVQVESQEGP